MAQITSRPQGSPSVLATTTPRQHRSGNQIRFEGITSDDLVQVKDELNEWISRMKLSSKDKAKLRRTMSKKLNIWILAFGGEIDLDSLIFSD